MSEGELTPACSWYSGGVTPRMDCLAETRAFMNEFTAEYHRYARKAYNMCCYLVPKLKLGWIVFSTAMHYFHTFVAKHSYQKVEPILLIAAATFLASKVEHFKLRLSRLILVAFESAEDDDDHDIRKQQVISVELMLCHTLQFDFVKIHPFARIEQLAAPTTLVAKYANKLYSYTCISPLCLHASYNDIAEALVWMVAEALGVLEEYLPKMRNLDRTMCQNIQKGTLDVLVLMKKETSLEKIDAQVCDRRRCAKEFGLGTPTPQHVEEKLAHQ